MKVGDACYVTASTNSSKFGVAYHSSNKNVATVDENGNVKAVGAGSCEIVAASTDSGARAVCTVTVQAPQKPAVTPTVTPQNTTKIGTVVTLSTAVYKVTASNTVTYQKPVSAKASTVKIPSTVVINNKTYYVTAIAKNAFKGNKKLKKVTIGNNVTTIGSSAFYGCKNLSKVTIVSNVMKKVGSKAFKGSEKTITFKVPKKQLEKYKKMLKSKSGDCVVKK